MDRRVRVRAYLGLGSRYSYLASTQLAKIETQTGAAFEWIPLNSARLIREANGGVSPFDGKPPLGQYDPAFRDRDAKRWAGHYGVPYRAPDLSGLPPDALALACWCAADGAARRALMTTLYALVFGTGAKPGMDALEEIAARYGVAAGDIAGALAGGAASARHDAAIAGALREGVFGVPAFVAGGETFWGNDRLPLLLDHLRRGG